MLFQVKVFLDGIRSQEKGQGLVEYALIILLVSIVVIIALTALGPQIATVYNNISTALADA